MRRVLYVFLLIMAFCLPSNGQIREIFDNGEIVEYYGGLIFETLGESIYSYRFVYGRYPEDKQALLDFQRDRAIVEAKEKVLLRGLLLDLFSGDVEFEYLDDSLHTSLLAKRDSLIAVDLNDPENVLTVIGDTCTFTYAKATRESYYFGLDDPIPGVKLRAIQCIGGPADLQKKDYRSFRQHIHTLAYDKKVNGCGNCVQMHLTRHGRLVGSIILSCPGIRETILTGTVSMGWPDRCSYLSR